MDEYYITAITPHVMNCTRELYDHYNGSETDQWMLVTNEILYYAYPVVMFLALLSTLLSSIITSRMVTDSHECYLTGFNYASFFMILTGVAIQIPNYAVIPYDSLYTDMLAYLPAVENWCWYTCSWLLFTAAAERTGHAMCGRWNASFGQIHGILASLLIVIICFVTSLPQYWEFRISKLYVEHDTHNCTRWVITPRDAIVREKGGYVDEYLYYNWVVMIFSIALPYLVMPILLPVMCCVKMHSYTVLSTNGNISSYADDYTEKDDVKDERSFNRLLGFLIIFYLLMSGPKNAVKLVHYPPFFMKICDNQLLAETLVLLFDVCFYLLFVFVFFICLCMSSKFRSATKSLKCRRCCNRNNSG